MKQRSKKAVSPVLATLMMVAVAVAMSVIIFTWSQSFLSQTGEAASGQQAAQNIAAQSGILIESVVTDQWDNTDGGYIKLYVRNVGAVSVTLGTVVITPGSGNTGLTNPVTASYTSSGWSIVPDGTKITISPTGTQPIGKGSSYILTITFTISADSGYRPASGDVITVKATTQTGTFAQATYTIP